MIQSRYHHTKIEPSIEYQACGNPEYTERSKSTAAITIEIGINIDNTEKLGISEKVLTSSMIAGQPVNITTMTAVIYPENGLGLVVSLNLEHVGIIRLNLSVVTSLLIVGLGFFSSFI